MSIVDFQSQLNSSQPSLTNQIPTSAISLDDFTQNSLLNIPTSSNTLMTTTAPSSNAFVSSALAVSSMPSLDSLSKAIPLSNTTLPLTSSLPLSTSLPLSATTLALPTASTQAVTAQITSMSPLTNSQTSLQLSQAQLQSQLAKQIKTNKNPLPSINIPTPTVAKSTTATALQNLNQIKKPAKQTTPTTNAQTSLVNIPTTNKIANVNHIKTATVTTTSLPTTNTLTVATPTSSTTTTVVPEIPKPKRISSTPINSITIPTPSSQMINNTLSNSNLQSYQSLIQLQTSQQQQQQQQQKLNLTQLVNAQIKIPSSQDILKDELDQLTSSNDLLLNGLTTAKITTTTAAATTTETAATTTTTLNNSTTKAKKAATATTTPVEATTKKSNSLNQASTTSTTTAAATTTTALKTPQTPKLNSLTKNESTATKPGSLLNKTEPITHININYNGTANDDINSVLYGKLSNNFNVNKTSADVSPINPSYNNKTLMNPIYGQQPSSQNEKIMYVKFHLKLFFI